MKEFYVSKLSKLRVLFGYDELLENIIKCIIKSSLVTFQKDFELNLSV